MAVHTFHPVIQRWFSGRFAGPTEPQSLGWPEIASGKHTLIAAPTGSGKTLTAFLAVIDRLFREGAEGRLADEMRVVYVSPLRALSNDMHRNLEVPLAEIGAQADADGVAVPQLRVGLRTGDTPSHRRAALVKNPPHILVTTPESLYLMLTAEKSRDVLRSVDTLIVDEIHALVRDKRGSHLSLSVERLAALTQRPLQRIGLSATQKPIERMADFLVGTGSVAISHSPLPREPLSTRPDNIAGEGPGVRGKHSPVLFGPSPPIESCGRTTHLPGEREASSAPISIINVGHARTLDLAIETPPSDLSAVCSHEQWKEINARLVELIQEHRSTLVFVNTRKLAERVTHQLSELLGEEMVSCHHGSLATDLRLDTEQKLKAGRIKAVVATASLELGIDVGHVDLVVQLGSPRSIATFLQRIGRSGHALGLTPKGRLFALTRDELIECMGLIRAIGQGRLDAIPIPEAPLDVLAQQIVAETSAREWSTDELFALCRRAYPYRSLSRRQFDETLRYLSEGLTSTSGRTLALLHHDQVNGRLRGRRNARLTAISNAGAIPEVDSIRVVLDPENTVVGSVDEEFGVESSAGDVFQLGNSSWRIRQLRGNDLIVTDAHGAPPTIPFWQGEAPGRTIELSEEVSRLREDLERRIVESGFNAVASEASKEVSSLPREALSTQIDEIAGEGPGVRDENEPATSPHPLVAQIASECHCSPHAAEQAITYVAAQKAAIGIVPTQQRIVFERFFDESGGMQLVVHAPFGSRVNKAWGFAMRKRFCRSFDFELQATADDDGFILSLGPQHSFPIESLFAMLRTDNARNLLEQAVLAVPVFHVRWRWNATRALQVARSRNGKKVPPAIQRFRSEDLLTAVFPKLTGCQENITGDHELPDHPLMRQTMDDCLHEALDLDGLLQVLARIESGEITLTGRDTREPSPFAYELLNANPYAFLDGGEIQERRAMAASTRRTLTVDSVRDLGRLDPEAIAQVVAEAQPLVRNADELHDVLLSRVFVPIDEASQRDDGEGKHPPFRGDPVDDWQSYYAELERDARATVVRFEASRQAWVAAERWPMMQAMFPDVAPDQTLTVPPGIEADWSSTDARLAAVRGLLEVAGPITAREISALLGFSIEQSDAALQGLEGEGIVLQGQFREYESGERHSAEDAGEREPPGRPTSRAPEWCHRRLLARIHRLTVAGLRREIEPVELPAYLRFLHQHHGLTGESRRTGTNGLFEVVAQLQGLDLPAICWERDVLPARLSGYRGDWLDELCLTGEIAWGRLYPKPRKAEASRPMASITRVAPISLFLREDRGWLTEVRPPAELSILSSDAQVVLDVLRNQGAMFAADILRETPLLPGQLDDALGELVVRGLITSDGIAGMRSLVRLAATSGRGDSARKRAPRVVRRRRSSGTAGRWSVWRREVGTDLAESASPKRTRDPERLRAERDRRREIVEQWAWQLVRRWGVIFKDLLRRESGAPPWWELVQVYRRLEARGELRGGRFIKGVAGEQFALADSIRELRRCRDAKPSSEITVLSAADPLNLLGVVNSEERVPATAGNRIAYLDGRPVAARETGELRWLATVSDAVRPLVLQQLGVDAPATRRAIGSESSDEPPAGQEEERNGRERKRRYPSGIPRPLIS